MKKFIVFTLLICLSFLFTSCATTTGAIEISGHYNQENNSSTIINGGYAIFIDNKFIYNYSNEITDLPVGKHHVIVRHPNKTLVDTTIYVSNEWSIQNKTHIFLGLAFSAGMALIPFPSSILYFLTASIPVFIANSAHIEGMTPLDLKAHPHPILTKTDSAIGLQLSSYTTKSFQEKDTLGYYPSSYTGIIKTDEFCYDPNAPIEPLIWFTKKNLFNHLLYAIPRKHITICKSADPDNNDCGPKYEAILEEHLCPQL